MVNIFIKAQIIVFISFFDHTKIQKAI